MFKTTHGTIIRGKSSNNYEVGLPYYFRTILTINLQGFKWANET